MLKKNTVNEISNLQMLLANRIYDSFATRMKKKKKKGENMLYARINQIRGKTNHHSPYHIRNREKKNQNNQKNGKILQWITTGRFHVSQDPSIKSVQNFCSDSAVLYLFLVNQFLMVLFFS